MAAAMAELRALFCEALECPSEEERRAFLDRVCGDDRELRSRIEALLAAHQEAGAFLERPASPPTGLWEEPAPVEPPGATIGPYVLIERLGEGGMGVVYRAEQTQPVHRKVALKIIKPGMDTEQVVARFELERQALALMDHHNIARVLDAGATAAGRPYFVMDLVEGVPITAYCDQNHLAIAERLDLFVLVCRAVQHAHQKGIIHRDLKPSNVLVTLQDGVPVPRIIDFGVAKATGQGLAADATLTGLAQVVGTPLYMSPEQADDSAHDIDTRSDVYSLGVLLYELLTGTTPFEPDSDHKASFVELRRLLREQDPPAPSTRLSALSDADRSSVSANRHSDPCHLGRAVHGELDWIVMKCLEKDRARRYDSVSGLADDLMRYLTDQPVEAGPPSRLYRLAKFARRNHVALLTVGLVVLSLLAGSAVSTWQAVEARKARRATAAALAIAQRQRETARRAVDEMYTQVAQKWLSREGGLTPLQKEFLEKALAFYEDFAREQADDPGARAEAARAAARVGEIRDQLGQSAGAMESYRKALDIFRRLAAQFPDRPEYRREVAHCLDEIGHLQKTLGRTKDAESASRDALDLREQLAKAPGTPDDRADLADSLQRLGVLLEETDRTDVAERAELRAADLLDRLVAEFPREVRYQDLLATTENDLGVLYDHNDQNGKVEARYRRVLDLRLRLAAADPADPGQQLELARCYHNNAAFQQSLYRPARAVEEYRHALPIEEKLVADHPDRPRYRSLLTGTLNALAWAFSTIGRLDDAEQAIRRSLDVAEKLAGDFPDVLEYRRRASLVLVDLGAILVQRGLNREARGVYERAYKIDKQLVAEHPDLVGCREAFVATCYQAAVNYATMTGREAGDVARARELARESVAFLALPPQGEGPGMWKGLALAEYRAGDLEAALKAETRALEIRKFRGYNYDWLLLALIHFGRGNRDLGRAWFGRAYLAKAAAGTWGGEPDLRRLGAEAEVLLREFIPKRPEDLRLAWSILLEDHRRRLGPTHPETLNAMDQLADQLAQGGQDRQAATLFEEVRRIDPGRYELGDGTAWGPWFPLAVLKLRAADRGGFGAVVDEMYRRFEGTKEPIIAGHVARLWTLLPGASAELARLLDLARVAVAGEADNPWFLLARGAVEYRAGQYRAAVETLTLALSRQAYPAGRVQTQSILAMAHARLGDLEAARRVLAGADHALALATATTEIDQYGFPRGWHWREAAMAQILYREAEGVLLDAAFPADPFAHRTGS